LFSEVISAAMAVSDGTTNENPKRLTSPNLATLKENPAAPKLISQALWLCAKNIFD